MVGSLYPTQLLLLPCTLFVSGAGLVFKKDESILQLFILVATINLHGGLLNWSTTVLEVGPKLLNYFANSFSRDVAKDLVQEVLVRLVHKVEGGQFDSEKGSLQAYAFGIAHLVRLEQLRQLKKQRQQDDIDDLEIAGRCEIQQTDYQLILRKSLQVLSEAEKEIILLLINEDLQYEEISQILNTPINTVRSHILRAKQKMQDFIQSEVVRG